MPVNPGRDCAMDASESAPGPAARACRVIADNSEVTAPKRQDSRDLSALNAAHRGSGARRPPPPASRRAVTGDCRGGGIVGGLGAGVRGSGRRATPMRWGASLWQTDGLAPSDGPAAPAHRGGLPAAEVAPL